MVFSSRVQVTFNFSRPSLVFTPISLCNLNLLRTHSVDTILYILNHQPDTLFSLLIYLLPPVSRLSPRTESLISPFTCPYFLFTSPTSLSLFTLLHITCLYFSLVSRCSDFFLFSSDYFLFKYFHKFWFFSSILRRLLFSCMLFLSFLSLQVSFASYLSCFLPFIHFPSSASTVSSSYYLLSLISPYIPSFPTLAFSPSPHPHS